ncbi:hypothetical protein Tco_0210960 [Tanacetum coccineum]
MKSVSMKQRLAGKKSLKTKWMQKESVSKQGRKLAKAEPIVHKDPAFDDLDDIMDNAIDYMESEDAQDEGRTNEGTNKSKVSTDKPEVSTAKPKEVEVSIDNLDEGTAEPIDGTSDESVEIKDAEDSDRPRATSTRSVLRLKPLPKIDPKEKGKKVLEEEAESDAESEGVDEAERKFDQLAKDEEIARKVQEDWEAEKEMKKLVEERAKFLYDTIAAQRRFLAQQRAVAIRSGPPTRTQLRNQMMTYLKHVGGKKHADFMTYLKHVGGKKHADLKNKNFEEIQVLYKKIKEINEESKDLKKKRLKKRVVNETPKEEDTAKVPAEQEVTKQGTKKRKSGHAKMIAKKRPRPQPDDDSDDEHIKCLKIVSSPDGDYLVVYRVNGHFRTFNYLMVVLDIFDRHDLFHLYDLVMKQYSEITPEELKDRIVIHMLVERRYPLSKELLQRMLYLGLEVEEESTDALHLVRFIKQQLNEE